MKNFITVILGAMLFGHTAMAVDLGALDTSFSNDGSSDGWDRSGEMGLHRYGSDVLVDSQGRIYVVGTYDYEQNGNTLKGARVERWLSNGQLDTSFDLDGIRELGLPPAPVNQFEYELQLDTSDGVFVGYSREFCISNNDCESDIYIYHLNANGMILDTLQVDFDLGSANSRKDDDFADMVYVPSINKLAITAEVERNATNDTDYGIAVLTVDPVSGALSMDTAFSSDGKHQCFFDHQTASGSQDKPEAIVWNASLNHFIVGGSTFEGNGAGADGWNMSFCEFDLQGNVVRKWSTEPLPDTLDDREFVGDMQMVYTTGIGGSSSLIVAGARSGAGGLDTVVTRYVLNQLSGWEVDLSFGSGGTGYETTGFQYVFVGDTNDLAKELLVEDSGALLVLTAMSWPSAGLGKGATALSRYTADGRLDRNWGIGRSGKAVHSFDVANLWDVPEALAVDPKVGEIYVTGFSYDGADFKSTLANMHNDGIFVDDFDD